MKEGNEIKELIQVTYASRRDKVEKREIKALEKAGKELGCKKKTVITWDYEEEIGHKIWTICLLSFSSIIVFNRYIYHIFMHSFISTSYFLFTILSIIL